MELTKIAVHGVPRSGTTWIGEILNSAPEVVYKFQPFFSYALKGFLGPDSSTERVEEFFRLLATTADDFLDQTEKRGRGVLPMFEKAAATHIVYKEVRYHHILANLMRVSPDLRLVAIVRNPLSVLTSWLRAPREFRADLGWQEQEEWRHAARKNLERPEEFNGYEKWKEATQLFLSLGAEYPNRVHVVEYGAFVRSTEAASRELFRFCSLDYSQQTLEFVRKSVGVDNPDPYSVFRSSQGDDKWRSSLSATIADAVIRDLRGTALERYLDL